MGCSQGAPSEDATGSADPDPRGAEPTQEAPALPVLRVLVISDFGHPNPQLAAAMHAYATIHGFPDCVLGLGDNFYEAGVSSVDDPQFASSWRDVYLVHESLRCPWHLVLGNHDYRGDPEAQVAYSSSEHNSDRVWNMPAKNYSFSAGPVDFFALDTNACSWETRESHPDTAEELFEAVRALDQQLQRSDPARLRVVVGHHPMYTRGLHHSKSGQLLRNPAFTYTYKGEHSLVGYDLENVLARHGVPLYLSGHEHVLQYHLARGVHHFVCGAAFESHFLGGEDAAQPITWVDRDFSTGFLALEVMADLSVSAKFVEVKMGLGVTAEPLRVLFEALVARVGAV